MDTRTDSGQFYPGGKVLPRQPGGGGGGGTVVLDDTVTETSSNGVKSSGIWSWVKSLLPSWLTASREEPPTVASVNGKYTKPADGIPKTDLASDVLTSLGKADTAIQNHQDISGKRDLDNRQWGERTFSEWTITAEQNVAEALVGVTPVVSISEGTTYPWEVSIGPFADGWNQGGTYEASGPDAESVQIWVVNGDGINGRVTATRTETTDRLALESDTDEKLAGKVDAVAGKVLSTNDYDDEAVAEVAKVKDKRDKDDYNVDARTFTDWDTTIPDGDELRLSRVETEEECVVWTWDGPGYYWVVHKSDGSDVFGGRACGLYDLTIPSTEYEEGKSFSATRTETTRKLLQSGLSASGEPLDTNVRDLFSKSDTFATDKHLKNSVLEESVNALIDAKVGDIDDALDALNGEVA